MPTRPFEKGLAVAIPVLSIVIPIVTAWIAGQYADASARRDANVRMVEVAVGVLQQPPSPATRVMRVWAVAVVDKYSEVPLGEVARRALTDSIVLPEAAWTFTNGKRLIGIMGRDTMTFDPRRPRIH